jgi:tryptophan-rich sensory protein
VSAISSDIAGSRALALLAFIGAGWVTGALGGQFAPGEWYHSLHKPLITPPDWVFSVVWPVLYTLIGVAGWLVWERERKLQPAHRLWAVLLVLNAAWPWLFFGLHRIDLALACLVALLLVVIATAWQFWRLRPVATVVLAPYFAWLLFAGLLNVAMFGLN